MILNEMNEKMQVFLDGNTKIHIDLFDGTFLNGFIIKNVRENVWLIKEDKLGDVFVFLREIALLEQNREARK